VTQSSLAGRVSGLLGRSADPAEAAGPRSRPRGERARVITILGMHRSGTSALAGSLEAAGLDLGEVRSEGGDSNPKGHREPGELIKLHEDVLISNGGAWHLAPPGVSWTAVHRRRRDAFIASRDGLPLWGWKEPRTLLVMDGWLEVLPELEMVGTFRHPAVVARSLQRRHGSASPAMWLDLWLAYNDRLLALTEQRHVPLIDFDLPAEGYRSRLRAIVDGLALPWAQQADAFFEAESRTSQQQVPPDAALPAEVRRVYDRLRELADSQASG